MPVQEHTSFNQPSISTRLWRYIDVPKFLEMLTSRQLWLTSAEVLAKDDPYEGLPGPVRYPHRVWKSIEEVPPNFQRTIINHARRSEPDASAEQAFKQWFMVEEQRSIMEASGRPNYFINCWHAATHESAAMWKIYAAPGAGIAILSNGGRLTAALAKEERILHFGSVRYMDPDVVQMGLPNSFDPYVLKRSSYSYEQEVRLVHWDTATFHDALEHAVWNDATWRYDGLIDDPRLLAPGVSLECDIDILIEGVIISPFAPPWYSNMIGRLRDHLGFSFPIYSSSLLQTPVVVE